MYRVRKSARAISIFFTVMMVFISVPVQSVFAAMIGTESVLNHEQSISARQKIHTFLARQDVHRVITSRGIDPEEAKARIDSLSDMEIQQLAHKIDSVPAGGIIGTIAVIGVIFFLTLLILDMLGVTDVFSFINGPKK